MDFTALFKKVPEGYIACAEELPGAGTQGAMRMAIGWSGRT
jgi:hypothetical protein